ncbi:inositol monophosphatase family protein [Streptococcus sp. S784/96/1]|uniref:inositol monophosphatase family protein n=1 Tax=Streptococcus sp. S784/96/1 TaxID=2653499 RepID=UPI001389C25D|nr:inositol monophosphatase family protein [Streptococcus sp. S784/96/1]
MENKFAFAQDLIKKAGQLVIEQMKDVFDVTVKTTQDDVVTSIDIAIQNFLIQSIAEHYPEDHFLAEEENCQHGISVGNVWVIDPIDGTLNFVTQKSDFAIMISYFEKGSGQFGLIYDVMEDKLYSGGGVFSVTCNDEKLPVFDGRPLSHSLVACNTGMLLKNSYGVQELLKHSLGVRNYGCAALSIVRVLNNQLWAYISNVYPWDYAAANVLGQALGYELMTLDGSDIDYTNRQMVIFLPSQYKNTIQELHFRS